jgi:putative acetyltransferase
MFTIRPATQNDLEFITRIHRASFPGPDEARLVENLYKNQKAIISILAEQNREVIGHSLFSPVHLSDAPAGLRGLGLAPVAVLPSYQRMGAGTGMIQLGLKMAHLRGFDYVVVLGDPAYYRRFGFATASQRGLQNEYGVDAEFMVIEFRKGALAAGGLVRYSEEFKTLGG